MDDLNGWISLDEPTIYRHISHGKLKMPTLESMKAIEWDKFIKSIRISTKKDMMFRGILNDTENNKSYEVTVKEIFN